MNPLLRTAEETAVCAAELAKYVEPGMVIYLSGPLGAGKTTWVRGFLQALGFTGKVKSPTYTLVESYQLPAWTIYHFDLYRIKSARELLDIGIEEYFSPDTLCLIEWPDKGAPLLPPADIHCDIEFKDEGRHLGFTPGSLRGDALLKRMCSNNTR